MHKLHCTGSSYKTNHYMYNSYPNKNHMAKGALAHSIAVAGISAVRVARPTYVCTLKQKPGGLKVEGWSQHIFIHN